MAVAAKAGTPTETATMALLSTHSSQKNTGSAEPTASTMNTQLAGEAVLGTAVTRDSLATLAPPVQTLLR